MFKLIVLTIALFLFAAQAQTVALSVATYSDSACSTFVQSNELYGKSDGSVCSPIGGKSIKYSCNATHIIFAGYSDGACANAAGVSTFSKFFFFFMLKNFCIRNW